MLLVLIIAMVLTGLTAVGAFRAQKRASFDRAVSMVKDAAGQANLLALGSTSDAASAYGARIVYDPATNKTRVLVIRWPEPTNAAGAALELSWQLPDSVVVYAEGKPLSERQGQM